MATLTNRLEASSSTYDHTYDVFLSFRGIDTRLSFTNHLHTALENANLTTFLDDEDIQTGEELKPELKSAIKSSRASIIVLSKNYAFSTWCLDEMVLILDQHRNFNQIVIPIFYHVKPTDIRKQQSSFGDAMAEHKQRMETETNAAKRYEWAQKIEEWNRALTEVSDLKGKDVEGRLETEVIEEIVKDIYRRLPVPLTSTLPQLTGMEQSIQFVSLWLQGESSHTFDILTIFGMGQIGKTTLAKYVYGLHCHEFKKSSLVEDIGRRCAYQINQFKGLLDVQKQLCDDISKTSSIQVHDVSIYTSKIEKVVTRNKMFLVLDDIDTVDQLNALLGNKGFHPGSKIIITTKDASLTERCAQFDKQVKPTHTRHFLRGLCNNESLKLLCIHAFNCEGPKEGYEEVSNNLVKYCNGHPLALEVLGKSLRNQGVDIWEDCIERLKKESDYRIVKALRMSFDSLSSKNDKELFKHIACFFVGMDRHYTETILNGCYINVRSGIKNLIDRCLISIEWNNEMMMHPLLQEMGKDLIREESPNQPWNRTRLWGHDESFRVLKQKKGSENVLGLTLDMRMLEKEKLHGPFELEIDALSKMDNLILLQLNYVQMNGSFKNFPKELRWLCMHGFPLKFIPRDLPMENLVVLDLSFSKIESFGMCYSNPSHLDSRKMLTKSCSKDRKLLGSLKILNISFCYNLLTLGGFFDLPALEMLVVGNCGSLIEICESIEQCVELVLIDLSHCKRLQKLPRTIGNLKKVKTFLIDGCALLELPIKMKDMTSLETLNANNIGINLKTSSSVVEEAIPSDMKFIAISLPMSLVSLSLQYNNLSNESFPMDFSCLYMLKELYLEGNPVVSLPNCVRSLPRLEKLSVIRCPKLMTIEHPPCTLRILILSPWGIYSNRYLLRKVVFYQEMYPLNLIARPNLLAPSSFVIEGMVKIQPIADVEEKLLHGLGWTNLEFIKEKHLETYVLYRGLEGSQIQMYYEFGIFSTIYGGKMMPNWITLREKGPSISFTIPSSPNKIRGLNFCYVRTYQYPSETFQDAIEKFRYESLLSSLIIIKNKTKNRTWIYKHYVGLVHVEEEGLLFLSHWMFGEKEMEFGDQVTIVVTPPPPHQVLKECGVTFVYDDGETEEEEEDVLGYYKSWNHIIGGDLSPFQLTTGEYILDVRGFMRNSSEIGSYYRPFIADGAFFKVSDIPELVGSIESLELPFTCISVLREHDANGMTYKMFFRQSLSDVFFDQIFRTRSTLRINLDAYPHYHAYEKFAPFILDDKHLYYVNAIKNAANTMETSAVAAEKIDPVKVIQPTTAFEFELFEDFYFL